MALPTQRLPQAAPLRELPGAPLRKPESALPDPWATGEGRQRAVHAGLTAPGRGPARA